MDLSMLNREQRKAAETLEGPVLILAGAGSGKTRALTYRVANLIDHGIPAWNILALTFTNKAANEMKSRVAGLIGAEAADEAWISTFHSSCARILRRDIEKIGYSRSFVIYDDDDQTRVLKEVYKQLNIDEAFLPFREAKAKIGDAKNKMQTPDEWFASSVRDYRCNMIHDVMVTYERRLKTLNALDFDDLLLKTLLLLAENPPVLDFYRRRFRYVMVDEYQDTNTAQYEFVRLMTAESRNLCVVGDDDQSIYGWRGADIRNILDFEKDYPDAVVIKLEQNYRSTSNILDAANQVIANNEDRKDKMLWTESGEGEKIRVYCAQDEQDESAWIAQRILTMKQNGIPFSRNAVLYRTNAQSRVPEEMLMKAGIPYRVFGGQKFYERKEIKDILAYLRVIVNPSDDISLARIINVPKRSIGEATIQALADHAAAGDMPLYSALTDIPDTLNSRARNSVSAFALLMTRLMALKETMNTEDFVNALIERTGLEEQYVQENTEEARARLENISEFRGSLHEYIESSDNPTLEGYLENVSLVTDLDRASEADGFVTMMTLHSAKGLEFENVFIPGLEENIFPSGRSLNEDNRLEEERRLMYVGMTRARKRLYLSYACQRMLYNQFQHNPASRFLNEIPSRLIQRESFRGIRTAPPHRPGAPGIHSSDSLPHRPAGTGISANPKLTLHGVELDQIPGVSRGFVSSKAREETASLQKLFREGERVMHPKFGRGTVLQISGSGKNARISVQFDQTGVRELALAIAPIVRLEEET